MPRSPVCVSLSGQPAASRNTPRATALPARERSGTRPENERQPRISAGVGCGRIFAESVGDAEDVAHGVLSVGVGGDDVIARVCGERVVETGAQRGRLAAIRLVPQHRRARRRDPRERRRERRPAAVVDDHHLDVGVVGEESRDDRLEAVTRLVRGDEDDHGVTPRLRRQWRQTRRRCTGCRSWRAHRRWRAN